MHDLCHSKCCASRSGSLGFSLPLVPTDDERRRHTSSVACVPQRLVRSSMCLVLQGNQRWFFSTNLDLEGAFEASGAQVLRG